MKLRGVNPSFVEKVVSGRECRKYSTATSRPGDITRGTN